MIWMKAVTAAIILKDSCILIARRSPESKLAGQWEFPGGKLEDGESLQTCLKRELKEELGIDTEVSSHFCSSFYEYEHGSFTLEAFYVRWIGGEMTLNAHDQVEWVPVAELENYALLPADIPIARKLKEFHHSPQS